MSDPARTLARWAAYAIFAVAAAYDYTRGFIDGVRIAYLQHKQQSAAGATPFPAQPRPAARPVPERNYTVEMDADNEVTINGLPIGHIDSSPWQFCSYDTNYGNGPARPSKARAWDDACDYAESVVRCA